MKFKFFLLFLFSCLTTLGAEIKYSLTFPEAQAHYVHVTMEVDGFKGGDLLVKMPVWAPGSYLVREFSKSVEQVSAKGEGQSLRVEKVTKNTWRIKAGKNKKVFVSYAVYANELSVRTSYVDEEHAYLNGTSIFMFVPGLEKVRHRVVVSPRDSWKKISVALDRYKTDYSWDVVAPDYDELVDAPFEIGNHVVFEFTAAGVRHEVAMFGEGNYNIERLKKDMTTVVEKSTAVFGEHPCKYYLFIVHNLTSGGGGLEHKNSTTLQTNRWSYGSESSYSGFMSLVAHEYFHLWNVKRLRPQPLGPFNYDEENYTSMLWIAEGFTAYYDDLLAKRCGFYSENEYLKTLAGNISYVDNIRGGPYQSLAESSFDAWIKYYRPNENSGNSSVSYYTKGGVMGAMLDLQIRKATANKKSLDDVFREMYLLYAKKLDRGYTEAEFIAVVNKISGKDFTAFFNDYVNGVKSVPFASILQESGLVLNDLNKKQPAMWIGVTAAASGGKLSVSAIERGSPAWLAGVNTGDEILALDEYRVNDDLSKLLAMKSKGDKVTLLVSRNGFVKSFTMEVLPAPHVKYELSLAPSATDDQKAMFNDWLYGSK
jgi:predicted metalloprotease with PDZ domain